MSLRRLPLGKQFFGAERDELRREVVTAFQRDVPITVIAKTLDRSAKFVRTLLDEAGALVGRRPSAVLPELTGEARRALVTELGLRYEGLWSVPRLVRWCDQPPGIVSALVAEAGVPLRPYHDREDAIPAAQRAELAQELRRRYESDTTLSVRALAADTPHSPYIVRLLLHEAGTEIRDRNATNPENRRKMSDAELVELGTALRPLYRVGAARSKLADLAGRSPYLVTNALTAAGVSLRRGRSTTAQFGTPVHKPMSREEAAALGRLLWPHYASGTSIPDIAALVGPGTETIIAKALSKVAEIDSSVSSGNKKGRPRP